MRRLLCLLLAALLCAGAPACAAEDAGDAVLTFRSFDGGGHEYTVGIDDADLLACAVTRDYGARDELEDGSPFTVICAFTGLKPGTTTVRVYGRSPVMDNDDFIYTAVVDEALRVTLTPVRAIATFFLYRSGCDTYAVTREPDGCLVSVNDGEAQAIDEASVDALARAVETYDLARWDGFGESKIGVADGESFWLEIRLTDGTHILARGQNATPPDYLAAMDALQAILESAVTGDYEKEEASDMKLTIGDAPVPVTWEDNASVAALRALLPLEIEMSMYGGFEQVGPIGQSLPRDDAQTTTAPGDIVLYAGDQIVVFYGVNAWAYTRLGHVDLSRAELERLLGGGDVKITLEAG